MTVDFQDSDIDARIGASGALAFEPVHRRIDRWARLHPHAAALQDGTQVWSTSELDAAANRLAWHLRGLGAGPGEFVAICLPRSAEAIVCMLAVLKCGAAFVPLDPAYPAARRAHKIEDCRPLLVLSRRALADAMPPHPARDVWLDDPAVRDWIDRERQDPVPVEIDPEAPAYVIYTSGSTGKPKGVVIPHRALRGHALAVIQRYALMPTDRVLQFASLAFDISIEEIFPTLACGSTLVLHDAAAGGRIDDFLASVESHALTVLNLPTAFWHELVLAQPTWSRPFPACVRLLVVGGEKASRGLHGRWVEAVGPRPRWMNAYGPTEATVTATVYEPAAHPADDPSEDLPIGLPLSNTRCHVLDEALRPVAPGEEGELCIGGRSLALGYLNLPELTARRFVPDPFSRRVGARLYRTGDRARMRPDGSIAFLGRVDAQFKVRGFRIEAAEIEACIEGDPRVEQAIVIGWAGPSGETVLQAFLRLRPGHGWDEAPLRERLRRELPDYMHPATLSIVQAWPLLPNGKVDRSALDPLAAAPQPAPEPALPARHRPSLHCGATADADELASWLGPIFAEALGLGSVDPDASFFDQGGHSLLALRLLALLAAQRPQQAVPAELFFAHPSVNALAQALATQARRDVGADARAAPAASVVRLNRCSPQAEQRTPLLLLCGVALYGPLAQAMCQDRPVYGLFVPAELAAGGGADLPDLPSLASQYVLRIRPLLPDGPFALAGVSFGATLAFEVARQLDEQGRPPTLLALLDPITADALGPLAPWARVLEGWRRWRRRGTSDPALRRQDALDQTEQAYLVTRERYTRASLIVVATGHPEEPSALRRSDLGWLGRFCRADLGWSRYLPQGTPCQRVPGDHLGILKGAGALAIARALRELLDTGR